MAERVDSKRGDKVTGVEHVLDSGTVEQLYGRFDLGHVVVSVCNDSDHHGSRLLDSWALSTV